MKRKYVAARWGELTIRSWELKDYIGYRKCCYSAWFDR